LRFDYAGSDWPSAYSATQRFSVSDDVLEVRVRLINTGDAPMPAAIGLHPYFPKPRGTRVCASLPSLWLTDHECIPHSRVPTPNEWTFTDGRVLDDAVLDHCFGGWDGRARIEWPGTGVAIDIEADAPFGHAVIYSPKDRDFFCFEPVSNATDAVNLVARGEPDTGLVELAPGESLEGNVRFAVSRHC
jgi:aldose 1-epimerase